MKNELIKILNLEKIQDKIENIIINDDKKENMIFYKITLKKVINLTCPYCKSENIVIKEYYEKKLNLAVIQNNKSYISYKARRYKCKICNCTFYEPNPFSMKNDKLSLVTKLDILNDLKDHTLTFQAVAKKYNVSSPTVIKIFDQYIDVKRRPLPEVICIDEFYTSKTRQYKYACTLLDFNSNKIIEVYKTRKINYLSNELSKIPKKERLNVKYIVIDMWESYKNTCLIYFPNAKIAVDSFHVIKHLNDAVDTIRIKVMRKFDNKENNPLQNDMYYYMLKKFHYFFTKDFNKIYDGQIHIYKIKSKWTKHTILSYLLSIDVELKEAYYLKERYREFNLTANYNNCEKELNDFIEEFWNCKSVELRAFGSLLFNWKEEIKNSFIRYDNKRLSNSRIEGANSRIKVILKNANGYKNFFRLRNRIMYSLNKDIPVKGNIKLKK